MTLVLRQAKWRFSVCYTRTAHVQLYLVEPSFKIYEEKSLFSYYSREFTVKLLILKLVLELSNNGVLWTFRGCCFTYLLYNGYQVYRISDSYVKWSHTSDNENPSAFFAKSRAVPHTPAPLLVARSGLMRYSGFVTFQAEAAGSHWWVVHKKLRPERFTGKLQHTGEETAAPRFTESKCHCDKQFMYQNCN